MDGEFIKIETLLNGDQWNMWKFRIRIMLKAGDLYKFVSGEFPTPVWDKNGGK